MIDDEALHCGLRHSETMQIFHSYEIYKHSFHRKVDERN